MRNYNWDVARKNMREIRKREKCTASELSKKTGWQQKTISSYELGVHQAKISYVIDFCNYFNISIEDLFKDNLFEQESQNEFA